MKKRILKQRFLAVLLAFGTVCNVFRFTPLPVSAEYVDDSWLQFGKDHILAEDTDPLYYRNCGDHIVINGWQEIEPDLVIPAEIDGLPVTAIAAGLFEYSEIRSVTLPDCITEIGSGAFRSCENLRHVRLPSGLVHLGMNAFSGCSNLLDINIPAHLTDIGEHAFRDTAWLSNMQHQNPLVIVNGILIDGTAASGAVNVPDGVTAIAAHAFATVDSKLTSVRLPDSLRRIGSYAFGWCRGLTAVTLPDGLTEIADNAFWDCEALSAVTFPESVKSIGGDAFTLTAWLAERQAYDMFVTVNGILIDGRKAAGYVTIPDNVTSIAPLAFHGSAVTRITVPDSVKQIGWGAFWYCPNLSEILLPDSITELPESMCYACVNLTYITLPRCLTKIGNGAFQQCAGYDSITLPDTLKTIGDFAFYGLERLKAVRLPDGLEEIGSQAFGYCPALADVVIPESLTKIDNSAFQETPWIAAQRKQNPVVMANGVIFDIDPAAERIVLPDGVKDPEHWFTRNETVISVTLPESVNVLQYLAFAMCNSLAEITILNPQCTIFDHWTTICQTDYGEGERFTRELTIRGYDGSTAQAYAEKYGYTFVSLGEAPEVSRIPGDLNGDGKRNLKDVVLLRRYIAGGWNVTVDRTLADIYADNEANLKDVVALRRIIAGGYA